MDLRSIINSEATDNSAPKQVTPITPVQAAAPQQVSREYNHPQLVSATKHSSQDYGSRGSDQYASPTSYQGGYHGRPSAPPPLQPPSQSDLRSPAGSYSAQSPYTRHTPLSSINGGQYPFPQSQTPQSPAQTHLLANTLQHRESYPQSHVPPVQPQHQTTYAQQSPLSNTPTSATLSNTNLYFQQQRSHSSHSISTPTSAHSQQQYFNQYTQDSPVSTTSFPSAQLPQHQRQQSQPQTPLGPPISNSRQPSGNFPQSTSPYQQRPPSSGALNQPYPSSHTSTPPSLQHQHTRLPSTPSVQGSRQASLADSLPRSQSARERSVSISPKTQISDLPRNALKITHPQPVEHSRAQTPKRKMEDREASEPVGTPLTVNGGQLSQTSMTPSPQQPARKRIRYTEPPVWARSVTGRTKYLTGTASKRLPVNGKQVDTVGKTEPPNGHQPTANAPPKQLSQDAKVDSNTAGLLGPWEPSITGIRPYEEITKAVADWLFVHVVSRSDAGELASRGVEVEIEAKLGQLIHKDTNERFELPVVTECILSEKARVSFVSSMTEAQHKALNEFLNGKVEETHPGNPNRTEPRVPVVYAHRRERDRFYELPPSAQATLPACIRRELNPRHAVKLRVTHDQKTGQLLAKIIKTRVADLNIYNPRCPLDCRISVNMEMRYDGDIENLVTSVEDSRRPDRNKDRLSYTHSHYQIDLTQVTVTDPGVRMEKEHELEIEVSAAAVRDQGKRAMTGHPHMYRELIEGLMDNVRVLARAVPDNSAVL